MRPDSLDDADANDGRGGKQAVSQKRIDKLLQDQDSPFSNISLLKVVQS